MDMVPVYELGKGHQIFRITAPSMFHRFIGAPSMPDEVAGFVLVNPLEHPVSAMWMHTEQGKETGVVKNPIGSSNMRWPGHMPWSPYWREFVEQTISEDIADANFAQPVVMPDDLDALTAMPLQEIELFSLIDAYSKGTVSTWQARERAVRDHMHAMLQQAFSASPLVEVHRSYDGSIENILIRLLGSPETTSFQVEFVEDLPGWKLVEHPPRTRRSAFVSEGRTFKEALLRMQGLMEKDLRPFIPKGQLEAWWDGQRVEGESVYDLEPYFLLGTTSPMLFDTPSFLAWAEQQSAG